MDPDEVDNDVFVQLDQADTLDASLGLSPLTIM
jgi:hypothetical protein